MQASINGEARNFAEGSTLASLVDVLKLDTRKIAIEQNRVIIPRSLYAETPVVEGDQIEIVQFIGGG